MDGCQSTPGPLSLTESLSSRGRCGRPGVPAVAPFKRLYCVYRMFMVARRTSDKLCRTCKQKTTTTTRMNNK